MTPIISMAYLFAAVMFILALSGLSKHETAPRGVIYGMAGMAIAILATIFSPDVTNYLAIAIAMAIGAAIGIPLAKKVEMTEMPQLIALLHSFVGLAAVIIGWNGYLAAENQAYALQASLPGDAIIHNVEIYLGIFIGAVTLTGSLAAYGKLTGKLSSKPLMLPGRHMINLAIIVVSVIMMLFFAATAYSTGNTLMLAIMTILALIIGVHMVVAIGGADMPVVISMLNSYSGWAAAATGFMLGNDLLITVGALVGSSGAILSYIMCRAMNRSFISVILGGFGTDGSSTDEAIEGEISPIETDELASEILESQSLIIVPGFGMAVAHAQQTVCEMTNFLRTRGVEVRFAIHPVAGRLPGHMNVLLAEANVPYDIVEEMDEINDDFPSTDVVMVIGANDIVNPDALEKPDSPIAGMPVLEVWKARTTVVLKRSMATGYSGVENPLFYKDNTRMLFGDAKDSISKLLTALQNQAN